MAHLPISYEDRCLRTWFAAPNVQFSGNNPLHFCARLKTHSLECTCKCGAVERAIATGATRDEPHHESAGMGSRSTEDLSMGRSGVVEQAQRVDTGR